MIKNFWFFVPKSGVAFIFITVAAITVWNRYKTIITHPYYWIFGFEVILFIICFYIADHERITKKA